MAHSLSAAAPVVPSRDTKPLRAHTPTPQSLPPQSSPLVSSPATTSFTPSASGASSLSSPTTIPPSSATTTSIPIGVAPTEKHITAHTPPPTPPLPSRPATAATLTPTRLVQAQELPSPPPSPVLPALKSSTSSRDTAPPLARNAAEQEVSLEQSMTNPYDHGARLQAAVGDSSACSEDEAVLAYSIASPSNDPQTPIPPPIASHPIRDTSETPDTGHVSALTGSAAMPVMTDHAAHNPESGAIADAAGHEEPEDVLASSEVADEARRARRVRRWLASQCRLSMLVGSGAEYDTGEYDYDYDDEEEDEEEGDFEEGLYEKDGGRWVAGQRGSIAGQEKARGEEGDDNAHELEYDLRADSPLLGFSLVGPASAQGQPQFAQRDVDKPLPTLPPPEVSVSPTTVTLAASAASARTTQFNHLHHHHLDPSPTTVDSEDTHLRPDTNSITTTKETATKMTGTGALRRPNTQTHSPASSGGYTPPVSSAPVDQQQPLQDGEHAHMQSHSTVTPALTSARTRVHSQSPSVQVLYNPGAKQHVIQDYRRDEKQEGEEGQRDEHNQPEPAMYHLPTAMRRSRSSSQMLLSPGMAPLQTRTQVQTPTQVSAQAQAQTPIHAQYLANGPTPTLRSARSSLGPHHSFALGSGSGAGFGYGYGAGISSSSGAASVAGYTYAPRSSSLAASPMILSASPAMSRHMSLGPSPVGSHASLAPSPMTRHASLAPSVAPSVVPSVAPSVVPSVAPSIAPSPMLQASPLPPMTRQASLAPSHAPSMAPSPAATRHTSLAPSPMLQTSPLPPVLQASPLPPSAPPTRRSRAGSLSAAMSLSLSMAPVGEGAAVGGGATGEDGPVQGHSSTGSIGAGMRDAVYIDSEDVKARLDELLAQAGEEREVELERGMGLGLEHGMGLGLEGVDERAGGEVVMKDALMGRDPAEEEEAANALCTPPPSALGIGFPPNVYATPTNANAYSNSVGRVVVAPSSTTSVGASGAPHSPGSAASRPLLGHRSAQASQASLRSISISTQSHPYMTQHASSSQVYLGPASAQTASSQPQSPAAYSPQQLLPTGSYSHSHSHSHSQAHSQTPSQAHSRAGSLASSGSRRRSQPRSSRIHSRAASREGMNGAAVSVTSSPAPVHARLSRSSSALMSAQAQAHSRSHSRAGSGASPMTMSMTIPVPVPVPVRTEPAEKPTRPPPAPPLDLGVAGLGLGPAQGGAEETNGYDQAREGGEEKATYTEVDADAEVAGREEEEEDMSDEELERLQFLRGLRLEDRMEEFRGVDFPSGLDDGFAAADAATEERAVDDEEGVLPEEHSDREPEPAPAMMGSMSRWSLGSSVMDDPPEGEKKKKRKSFVTAFGGGGGGGGSAGGEAGDAQGTAANGPKKRGRLASFISRLSGVGVGGTVSAPGTTPSSPGVVPQSPANSGFPDGNTPASDPYAVPPVPAVPTALMPSPAIVEAAVRRVKSHESIQGIEVTGSVQGAWDPHPPSKTSAAVSPTRLRNAPLPAGQQRPAQAPPLMKAYSADVLGASPPFASTRKGPSRIVWQTELDDAERGERGEKVAALGGLRARSNTLGDVTLLASRRPALYKSASASVLVPAVGQQRVPLALARRAPGAIHTRIQYHGPPAVQDDSMPPTPSSIASTEIEEEDEEDDYGVEDQERSRLRREYEHEERWARLRANYTDVDPRVHMLPTIPQSPPPPEPGVPTKVETVLQSLAPAPPVAPSSAPAPSAEQRQRLKSMPSLVHIRSGLGTGTGPGSPPASASTADFGGGGVNPPPVSARAGKSSVFRGFVERMGFAGSSANNTANNSPLSSYPGTPLSPASSQLPGVLGNASTNASFDALAHYPLNGYSDSGMRSPSHSPTTSMAIGGALKEGGVFAPGGLLGKKKPKRKLVISGVPPNNTPAFEAVKNWCESFGEVREMTRGQNGNLYIDFKKASVADMVCRVQAQVSIKGAGSVSLSWYTKSKPT